MRAALPGVDRGGPHGDPRQSRCANHQHLLPQGAAPRARSSARRGHRRRGGGEVSGIADVIDGGSRTSATPDKWTILRHVSPARWFPAIVLRGAVSKAWTALRENRLPLSPRWWLQALLLHWRATRASFREAAPCGSADRMPLDASYDR